jgi:hypothetical protein
MQDQVLYSELRESVGKASYEALGEEVEISWEQLPESAKEMNRKCGEAAIGAYKQHIESKAPLWPIDDILGSLETECMIGVKLEKDGKISPEERQRRVAEAHSTAFRKIIGLYGRELKQEQGVSNV